MIRPLRLRVRMALTGLGTTLVMAGACVGFAGHVSAAEPPWQMPDLIGANLQQAIDTVTELTAPVELPISTSDSKGRRKQLNNSNWTVCWQSPKAGVEFTPKTAKYIAFAVKRASDDTCWN